MLSLSSNLNFKYNLYSYKLLGLVAMILTVSLSNYLVQFSLNKWLTLGAFTYPFSFLVTELINRFNGSQMARQVVYIGFFLAVVLSLQLATPKIALASGSAFLVSQLLDIFLFNQLNQYKWWVAPFFASLIASFVDTVVFWTLISLGESFFFLTYALGDFAVKGCIDLILLFPFRLFVKKRKKKNLKKPA